MTKGGSHLKKIILLQGFLFFGGLLFGIAAYVCLPDEQIFALQHFLSIQMQEMSDGASWTTLSSSIFHANCMDLLRLYLAGICLIGFPLICLFLFVKGFTFGFAGCFLLGHSPFLVLTRVFFTPLLIIAAALGCRFNFMLIQNRVSNPLHQLVQYTLVFLFLFLLTLVVSYLDGLSSNSFLHHLS